MCDLQLPIGFGFYHCKWLCWEVRRAEARVYWSLEHSEWHKQPKICLIDFDSGALAIPHKGKMTLFGKY